MVSTEALFVCLGRSRTGSVAAAGVDFVTVAQLCSSFGDCITRSLAHIFSNSGNAVKVDRFFTFIVVFVVVSNFTSLNVLQWLRDSAAKLRSLEDMLRPEFDRLVMLSCVRFFVFVQTVAFFGSVDDGRDWRELYKRFADGFLKLLLAIEGLLRDWDSQVVRTHLRASLEV